MPHILIRNVSDPVHALLQVQAESRGMSLQSFLAQTLIEVAERGQLSEAVRQWEQLARTRAATVDTVWAVDDIADSRIERDEALDDVTNAVRR